MVKASFQCLKAVQEFMEQKGIIKTNGWIVTGASKRGWTALLVGATNSSEVNIVGLAPVVPLVPDLLNEIHRQYQSYNGYSWAFKDYIETGIAKDMDGPIMEVGWKIIDPINYLERLEKIPKFLVVSSDDEFMQIDWTNIYYDKILGEKHLLIVANAEHSMLTGLKPLLSNLGTFIRSVASGIKERPTFNYFYDEVTGQLSVSFSDAKPLSVRLRYGQTFSTERRDFRWIIESNEFDNTVCDWPYIATPKYLEV